MNDVGLQSQFEVFFPHLSESFPGWTASLQLSVKEKATLDRERPVASESKTNSGPGGHTGRGLLTSLASSEMLTHFMICSFSE